MVAMANVGGPNRNGSAFFITLVDKEIEQLNRKHTIFGQVAEGLDTLDRINNTYCDTEGKPYQNIRIKHTLIIDDPYEDLPGMQIPSRSPSAGRNDNDRLEDDVNIDAMMKEKTEEQLQREIKDH